MSWWNPANWFGAPQSYLAPDTGDAIEMAMDSIDALHSKRMHLLKKSSDLLKEAKEHKAAGDSKRAMMCMRRRQQVDTMARQLEGQLANLEKTSMMMDSTATTVELAETLRTGSETIENLLKQVSVSDIEQVADDLDDNMIQATELGEALARPLGGGLEYPEDEANILAEMESWEPVKEDPRVDMLPDAPRDDNDNGNTKVLAQEKVPKIES